MRGGGGKDGGVEVGDLLLMRVKAEILFFESLNEEGSEARVIKRKVTVLILSDDFGNDRLDLLGDETDGVLAGVFPVVVDTF